MSHGFLAWACCCERFCLGQGETIKCTRLPNQFESNPWPEEEIFFEHSQELFPIYVWVSYMFDLAILSLFSLHHVYQPCQFATGALLRNGSELLGRRFTQERPGGWPTSPTFGWKFAWKDPGHSSRKRPVKGSSLNRGWKVGETSCNTT